MTDNGEIADNLVLGEPAISSDLTPDEMSRLLVFFNNCLVCDQETDLQRTIHDFSRFMGFEYAFCGHMTGAYRRGNPIEIMNISNPVEWLAEYSAGSYVEHDPVKNEIEGRLAVGADRGVVIWKDESEDLNARQLEILGRRRFFGLNHGFSAYCYSRRQQAGLVLSFSSTDKRPDERSTRLALMVVPHVNRCRRRLSLRARVATLTERELHVAEWLAEGKTNWEIAQILGVTESTVKFHVANILERLDARNRQDAVSILIAERYLT